MQTFIFSILFITVVFSLIGWIMWNLFSKEGQRKERKKILKKEIRRGMRDEEIDGGLYEEVLDEITEEELKKRRR